MGMAVAVAATVVMLNGSDSINVLFTIQLLIRLYMLQSNQSHHLYHRRLNRNSIVVSYVLKKEEEKNSLIENSLMEINNNEIKIIYR